VEESEGLGFHIDKEKLRDQVLTTSTNVAESLVGALGHIVGADRDANQPVSFRELAAQAEREQKEKEEREREREANSNSGGGGFFGGWGSSLMSGLENVVASMVEDDPVLRQSGDMKAKEEPLKFYRKDDESPERSMGTGLAGSRAAGGSLLLSGLQSAVASMVDLDPVLLKTPTPSIDEPLQLYRREDPKEQEKQKPQKNNSATSLFSGLNSVVASFVDGDVVHEEDHVIEKHTSKQKHVELNQQEEERSSIPAPGSNLIPNEKQPSEPEPETSVSVSVPVVSLKEPEPEVVEQPVATIYKQEVHSEPQPPKSSIIAVQEPPDVPSSLVASTSNVAAPVKTAVPPLPPSEAVEAKTSEPPIQPTVEASGPAEKPVVITRTRPVRNRAKK